MIVKLKLLIDNTSKTIHLHMDAEIERLENLRQINDHVTPEEISELKDHKEALISAVNDSQIRTDSIRLIWCTE